MVFSQPHTPLLLGKINNMTKIRYWQGAILWSLALLPCVATAQDDDSPKWTHHIDLEAKPGSKRSLGEADLFLPLAQNDRTLIFANLRGRFDDNSSREGNLGIGWRQMQESGWNFGLYGYFDRRRSDSGNYYNQATLGAEALGRNWDFRANGYLPVGTRVRTLGSTGGTTTAAISGTEIQVTTSAIWTREERSLKGFDAEVGWRTPLFDYEARRQLRLFVGGYHFSDAGVTVEGPRIRAELAMEELPWFNKESRLFLGAEAQHDNARGDQSFLSIRLRIPLGKTSMRPSPLNAQERRMTAPVMRDVDIVTQDRSVLSTPAVVETATQTTDGQTITVLDSATTSDLNAALATAGADSTVLLSGTFDTIANNGTTINLQSGQTVMGRGTLAVQTPSGRTATLNKTSTATITGYYSGGNKAIVEMAADSTLSGMTISQIGVGANGQYGVHATGKTGVVIANNTISISHDQVHVYGVHLENGSSATISGNTITAYNNNVSGTAMGVRLNQSSALIANNSFAVSNTGNFGIVATIFRQNGTLASPSAILPGSTGNIFTVADGLDCLSSGTVSGTFYYTNTSGVATSCQ